MMHIIEIRIVFFTINYKVRRCVMNDPERSGGYESMVWIQDNDGKEYACYVSDIRRKEDLTEEEKAKCLDVNQLIGTERW